MKYVDEASVRNAFLGYSALYPFERIYETWLDSISCGLPAVLVTGNEVGKKAETAAAIRDNMIVVAIAHRILADTHFPPFLSFRSEAIPEEKVIAITGIAMHTPRFTMNDDNPLRTDRAAWLSPKMSAVASPMRIAAIYVIHVFILKRIQHLYPVVNLGRWHHEQWNA